MAMVEQGERPVVSADQARAAWVMTPRNRPEELDRFLALWEAVAGPRPEGSVPLPVCEA